MKDLEKILSKHYASKYCIFTGNGTTAMYLIFKALNRQEKKVLYPDVTCPNPVNAAIYAGYNVEFCDINLENYTIDLIELEEKLKKGEFGIVVPTHIYGHRYDREKMKKICDKYDVFLLEDSAQITDVGMSDASIVSFGHTKILETDIGGGAILTENKELYEKALLERSLIKEKLEKYDEIFQEYREKYYLIMNMEKSEIEKFKEMKKLQEEYIKYFIYNIDNNLEIIDCIKNNEERIRERIEKRQLYLKNLKSEKIQNPQIKDEEALWRYTFIYTGNRDALVKKCREEQIDISTWYPGLSKIYLGDKKKNSEFLEKKVVNLWIDEKHSYNKIKSDINKINSIFEEIEDGN